MKLSEYIEGKGLKQKDFAEEVGITDAHLSQMLSGKRHPSRKLAEQIELATDGAVTAMELLYPHRGVPAGPPVGAY